MKVAVLGGYGVFGARLCELLLRDGHDVLIVGRHFESARALAERIGGRPMAVNIRKAPETIFKSSPDVVVDAVGPFHDYGSDPYVIPRLCLRHGADYLDLSDSADFTAGLSALDAQARESGRRLLSGASSVPGISSAVAAHRLLQASSVSSGRPLASGAAASGATSHAGAMRGAFVLLRHWSGACNSSKFPISAFFRRSSKPDRSCSAPVWNSTP